VRTGRSPIFVSNPRALLGPSLHDGQPWADLEFPLAGEYNVWNATAAAALAASCGVPKEAIGAALKSFKSVKRRLEVKAQVNGITIIDDFAHHPTAIAGTLKALRARYPGARLWAILEPRSNTLRRRVLQSDLARSLAQADEVIVAGVFRSEAVPENERLELPALAAEIEQNGRRARLFADADGIVETISPEMRSGDVVAILSNGGFGGIYEKLPARLRELAGKQ
jgi:UDP-N-acetylmuramate: L-alanyl-gamma-D-glutamyl-meso-diaminopimelate ligase